MTRSSRSIAPGGGSALSLPHLFLRCGLSDELAPPRFARPCSDSVSEAAWKRHASLSAARSSPYGQIDPRSRCPNQFIGIYGYPDTIRIPIFFSINL